MNRMTIVMKKIFGYGMLFSILMGGISFFGYLLAIITGGETAIVICEIIYTKIYPTLVVFTTSMILLGLFLIYISKIYESTNGEKQNK